MIAQPLFLGLVMVTATALTVAGVMMIVTALERRRDSGQMSNRLGVNRLDAVLLFEDGAFVDANERGEALLATLRPAAQRQSRWQSLLQHLKSAFPDIDQQLSALPDTGRLHLRAEDASGLELLAEWLSGTVRLTIIDTEEEAGGVLLDRLSLRAMNEETDILRRVCAKVPVLAWREDAAGQVIWANDAYLRHCTSLGTGLGAGAPADARTDGPVGWPLPALFPGAAAGSSQRLTLPGREVVNPAPAGGAGSARRNLRWFDVFRHADGTGQLAFAVSADGAQQAEKAKHEFVQTLSKTFATLPIGLGVFDRTRRLQLFNPALIDLTGLEPEFLASQPALAGFLNRLRDKRILPEPRDYAGWSRRLLDIEKGFETNQFEETWSLPSGQTYRVSASPHPDGALAFLIEDITSEIHMSRNIRAELETCQMALDAMPTAVALFSADGSLVQTNAAFGRLWAFEGEDALAGVSLAEAIGNWRDVSHDPALWDQIALLGQNGQPKERIHGRMQLDDGEILSVSACRAGAGSLMITFDQHDTRTAKTRNTGDGDKALMPDKGSPRHGRVSTTAPGPNDMTKGVAEPDPAALTVPSGNGPAGLPGQRSARPASASSIGGAPPELRFGRMPAAGPEQTTGVDVAARPEPLGVGDKACRESAPLPLQPTETMASPAPKEPRPRAGTAPKVLRRSSGRGHPGGTARSSA